MPRIQLPNGCTCSKPAIYPRNWDKPGADIRKDWYIRYRFYDPTVTEGKYQNGKQVPIKGMNEFKTLAERRIATKRLLEQELDLLKNRGYNPITKTFSVTTAEDYVIDKSTPFTTALHQALKQMDLAPSTMSDIRSVIKGVEKAALHLRLDRTFVSDIETMHVNSVLKRCSEIIGGWSNNRHNKYRAYLLMLFKTLAQFGAVKANPVRDIATKKRTKKIREVLTIQERRAVDEHLRKKSYPFWRLLHIFFHSGSRETEIVRVRGCDVDLVEQRVKYFVKKGREYREVWRTIKDIALPLWVEALKGCGAADYVFSDGLVCGPRSIRADQITRRWKRHVKDDKALHAQGIYVTADFYCLKHIHTSEVVQILSTPQKEKAVQEAARHNEHSSAMVIQIYDTGRTEREQEEIKNIRNRF